MLVGRRSCKETCGAHYDKCCPDKTCKYRWSKHCRRIPTEMTYWSQPSPLPSGFMMLGQDRCCSDLTCQNLQYLPFKSRQNNNNNNNNNNSNRAAFVYSAISNKCSWRCTLTYQKRKFFFTRNNGFKKAKERSFDRHVRLTTPSDVRMVGLRILSRKKSPNLVASSALDL